MNTNTAIQSSSPFDTLATQATQGERFGNKLPFVPSSAVSRAYRRITGVQFASMLVLALISGSASAANPFEQELFNALKQGVQEKVTGKSAVSVEEETAIGRQIAGNLLGAAPLVKDAKLQKYVNNVGRWVADQSERPELAWHFGVIESNDVNAFAAPGGYVFVTKGLLARMKSEAELAGVLAHEMSHVLRKHYLAAIKKGARTGLLAEFAGEALKSGGADPAFNKLVSAGTEVYARGLDKNDEFEADRMAVAIATRGGYDPYGLPAVLQTLQGMNAQDSSLALLFKTHPALNERLSLLDRLMSEEFDDFENQPDLAARFMGVMGKTGILAGSEKSAKR